MENSQQILLAISIYILMKFKIASVFGINLYIHVSWLILLLFIGFLFGFVAQLITITIFVFVLLHEFGHCLVAKLLKIEVYDITLHIFGGLARIKFDILMPKKEFLVALAGPLVNVIFLFAFLPFTHIVYFDILYKINLLMACFNMIPILPMDGGRVLRSILAIFCKDYLLSTIVAVRVGQFISLFLAILCLINLYIVTGIFFAIMIFISNTELTQTKLLLSLKSLRDILYEITGDRSILYATNSEVANCLESLPDDVKKDFEVEYLAGILRDLDAKMPVLQVGGCMVE